MDASRLTADGHTTNPPARYTEASLIKSLEELGIGRPSTYSVDHQDDPGSRLCPQEGQCAGALVDRIRGHRALEQHFGRLVDYDFTAAMEDELDEIAAGNERRTNWLNNFYFGGEHGVADSIARAGGLKKLVGVNLEGIDAREVNSIKLFDDEAGRSICVRVGKNGPYLERMIAGDDGEPTLSGPTSTTTSPRRTHTRTRRNLSPHRKKAGASASIRRPVTRSSRRTAATGPTSPKCCRRPRTMTAG